MLYLHCAVLNCRMPYLHCAILYGHKLYLHRAILYCHMMYLHCALLYCHMPYLHCALIYSLMLYLHCVMCYCEMLYLLTLCHIRLIDFFGINNFVKETRNKLTTFSSVASGDDPYKMYVLEEERMLAAITTLLSHTSN